MSRACVKIGATAVVCALTLGLAGASAVTSPSSYPSGDLTDSIPNDPGLERISTITVPDAEQIADVDISVRLAHPTDADLDLVLRHPDGTAIDLSSDNGAAGPDYGSGGAACADTATVFTTFDDEATGAVTAGTAPFGGSFQPESPLSVLDGKAANGAWKLEITDDAGGAEAAGTLYCWKVAITYAQTDLQVTLTDSPDPVATGSELTYTATVKNAGATGTTQTTLTQSLPAGATLVTTTVSQGTCTGTTTVTCSLGALASGATATAAFVVELASAGTVVATASAAGSTSELTPADNSASQTTTVSGSATGSETITVTTEGTGRGSVTSDPAGISCGFDCDGAFAPGAEVALTATPATGSTFEGWGGACTGTPAEEPCVLTASGDQEAVATFGGSVTGGDTGGDSGGTGGSGDTGGSGGGTFDICTITGTSGGDVLRGTSKRDVICGLGGDDKLYGLGGNDRLYGGPGRDVLFGGAGNDVFYTKDRAKDRIVGGAGKDRARVDGRDVLATVEGLV